MNTMTKGRRISQYVNSWETITESTVLELSGNVLVNSVGAVIITLPSEPVRGTWFNIMDGAGHSSIHPITLSSPGYNIEGHRANGSSTHIINVDYQSARIVFDGDRWVLSSNTEIARPDIEDIVSDIAIRMAIVFS